MWCFGFGRGVVSAVAARFIVICYLLVVICYLLFVICYLLVEFQMTSDKVRNAHLTDILCG